MDAVKKHLLSFLGIIAAGGVLFHLFENDGSLTFEDSLWWSLSTATTVGAADVYPKTWQGRWLVAAPITLISVAFLANLFGKLSAHHIQKLSQKPALEAGFGSLPPRMGPNIPGPPRPSISYPRPFPSGSGAKVSGMARRTCPSCG